jgi:aminoglycoside phosphotransferase (APT) family kinase protein
MREIFAASVTVDPDKPKRSGTYVAMIPRGGVDAALDERTERELKTLQRLTTMSLPFRVPRPVGAVSDIGGVALARGFVEGAPLALHAGGQPGVSPWDTLGELAAAIHSIDPWVFAGVLEDPGSRLSHARAQLRVFDGVDAPEVRDALAWARAHLPPEEPATLLHGDLFGKNVFIKRGLPPAIIDWEWAQLGDPAYELAVVTRGSRRPFGVEDGLERLIAAYAENGGSPRVEAAHVHVHALCMATEFYRYSLQPDTAEAPEMALGRVRNLLSRFA